MAESTHFESTRVLTPMLYSHNTPQDFAQNPIQSSTHPIGFVEAIFQGLAPDGGLYYPTNYIDLSHTFVQLDADITFVDMAALITHQLFPNEFSEEHAKIICEKAFPFSPTLHSLDDALMLLELFHGPSCAFKDFGASYLATIMEHALVSSQKHITILTATSGDTGSAVAQAFHNKKNIKVVILFPSQRISPLQEKQLTGVGDNIHALEVKGNFDDCQRMVKEAFQNQELRDTYNLSSANSINIGRLIPQAMYYIYAWNILRHKQEQSWAFCTPSGNFGNLTGGLLAKRWGMPVEHFVVASNANKVVPDYLSTGIYAPHESIATLANAMDVGSPSNFERMLTMYSPQFSSTSSNLLESYTTKEELLSHIHSNMRQDLYGVWADDNIIQQEIQHIHTHYNTFVCPHTAVGVHAARSALDTTNPQSLSAKYGYEKIIVLSTAHAGKFFETIQQITGVKPHLPQRLEVFLHTSSRMHTIEPTLHALVDSLMSINV